MSQTEYKKRLKALMNKPENQACADCPERQPRWASLIVPPPGSPPGSLKIGAFVCLECSGSHRRLGTHITFVRSVNLDSWKEAEVLAMENGGNKKVNAIFEANAQHAVKLTTLADGRTRERYIRDKYERRNFFDSNVLQSYINGGNEEDDEDEESDAEEAPTRQRSSKKIQPLRSPSDAAMRRAETRKSRIASASISSTNLVTQNNKEKKKFVKKKIENPPSAPITEPTVDLLDFGTPMKDPGPPPDPPSATPSPNLDLFKSMNVPVNAQNDNSVSDNAARAAETAMQDAPKKLPSFNESEILSKFNEPSVVPMGYSNGIMPGTNMMGAMNPMAMMQQQQRTNMSAFTSLPQQANMMAMMQQQQANMMMMQQQQQMMMNQASMGGNMQQHLAMMNNLHIGNTGGMVQRPVGGDSTQTQQMGIAQRPVAPKSEKSDPFDAFGCL